MRSSTVTLPVMHDARPLSCTGSQPSRQRLRARDTVGDFRLEITFELRLRDQMYALQQTTAWKDRYKIRSGIEATNSELKRAHGIGRLKVRRLAKVCFAVACKVTACNIKEMGQGPLCPGKAHIRLYRYCLSRSHVIVGQCGESTMFPENHLSLE